MNFMDYSSLPKRFSALLFADFRIPSAILIAVCIHLDNNLPTFHNLPLGFFPRMPQATFGLANKLRTCHREPNAAQVRKGHFSAKIF
ncbi:MAG: hypothetical protein PHV02_03175 [Rhodocyclaceae bacterium]|nr:hypothetical protein [Rhodocyclaceae bacterium]